MKKSTPEHRATMCHKTSAMLLFSLGLMTGLRAGIEQTISLPECIQLALRHNLDLAMTKANVEISEASLRSARAGYYDPSLSISGSTRSDTQPGGIDDYNRTFPGSNTESNSYSTGLSVRTPTGGTIGLRGYLNDSDGSNAGGSFMTASGSVFAEIRQPFLKGFVLDGGRLTIKLRRRDLDISELAMESDIMRLVSQVELAYIELITARANLTVREEAASLAEKILDGDRKRIAAATLAPYDAKQSEAQTQARHVDLLQAQQSVYFAENTLKVLFTDDFAAWRNTRLIPDQSLNETELEVLDIDSSWQRGMDNRPDLRQAEIELEKQELSVRYAKQSRLPSLDAVGRYGLAGSGLNHDAVREGITHRNGPSWTVGLELSFPLTNRAARSEYKIAQLRLQQQRTAQRKLKQRVLIEIDNAFRAAELARERVAAAASAEQLAEEAVEAEEKKLSTGRSTTFVVLQLQNNLTEARLQTVLANAQYERALVQLKLSEGATLTHHNIELESIEENP